MSGSLKALSSGQFGEFPHYAFTTEGIWALRGVDNGSFMAVQEINRCVIRHPEAVASLPEGVAYICSSGVYVLSGSSSKNIGEGLISLLLKNDESTSGEGYRNFLKTGRLFYNRLSDCLVAAYDSSLFVSKGGNGTWQKLDMEDSDDISDVSGIKCHIEGIEDTLLRSGNGIFDIDCRVVSKNIGEWNVTTCALQTLSGKRLRAFRALGVSNEDDFQVGLWGSCDMRKWIPLIRTSSTTAIPYFGPVWQWYAAGCKGTKLPTGLELYFDN